MTIPAFQKIICCLLAVACSCSSIVAQQVNSDMREFHFEGANDTRKSSWDTKKLPVTGVATYKGQVSRKWVGNFLKGHLHGSFALFDYKDSLLLEGEARMDTIVRATQYKIINWQKRKVLPNGAAVADQFFFNLPVFTGYWKNKKWHSGRLLYYGMDNYTPPYLGAYTEAIFNEQGYPAKAIYKYNLHISNKDSVFYLASYQENKKDVQSFYRPDGSLRETLLMNPYENYDKTKDYALEEIYYPKPDNKEGIAWLKAPAGNFPFRYVYGSFHEYEEGSINHEIKGWLHTQYKDGRCSKILYDFDGKPVPGAVWMLPAAATGQRPDSLNFASIDWKRGNFSGGVVNGKPNGWGRWLKEGNNRVIEGFFKEGEHIGLAAEMQGYLYTENKFFAVYKDGQLSNSHKVLDPDVVAAERKKQEEELKKIYAELDRLSKPALPPPLPGPKRVVSWNAAEGTVRWSDHTITRGTQIKPMEVKAGMVMMHNNRVQVVQYPPMSGLNTIVFYGTKKENAYTWSPNVQTVVIYPELESFKTSLLGTCGVCNGTTKVLSRVFDGQGDQYYRNANALELMRNPDLKYYYLPVLIEIPCKACEASGIMPKQ